jgi:hypothetical protein
VYSIACGYVFYYETPRPANKPPSRPRQGRSVSSRRRQDPKLKTDETQYRWLTAIKDGAFDSIRNLVVLETQAEHFLKVLEKGSVSTTIYLRRVPISPSI